MMSPEPWHKNSTCKKMNFTGLEWWGPLFFLHYLEQTAWALSRLYNLHSIRRINNAQHDTDFVLMLPSILGQRYVTWLKSSCTPSDKMEISRMGENRRKPCQVCKKRISIPYENHGFPHQVCKNNRIYDGGEAETRKSLANFQII